MKEYTIGPLEATGNNGEPLPNRMFRGNGSASGLAILFPGLRYSCDMPLLFYPTKLFLQLGYDVLQVHADYTGESFSEQPPDRQLDWLAADAAGALRAGLAEKHYTRLAMAGKSIGTLAMSVVLIQNPELRKAITIWITPLFRLPQVEKATQLLEGPALFLAGTGDNTFDSNRLAYLQSVKQIKALVFNGADHSLEIRGDIHRSLDYLQQAMSGMGEFLQTSSVTEGNRGAKA